jgi:membrane fusion protein, copper/silver efflux system
MKYNLCFLLLFILIMLNGCSDKKNNTHPQMSDSIGQDNNSHEDKGNLPILKMQIIREGLIDLTSIDQNNDKKVFECSMDLNVIDDKPGSCPLCKMDLEEFPLSEVRNNLLKNDFKVK